MSWENERNKVIYAQQFSSFIVQLINYKMFFYANFVTLIFNRFRQMSYVKFNKKEILA